MQFSLMNPNQLFLPTYKFLLKQGTQIEFLEKLSTFVRSERCCGLTTKLYLGGNNRLGFINENCISY